MTSVAKYVIVLLALLAVLSVRQGNERRNRSAPSKPHSVDLRWNASESAVAGYVVYRAPQSSGPYLKLNKSPVRETRFADTTIEAGHAYFYAVTALDSHGRESDLSNKVQAVIPFP